MVLNPGAYKRKAKADYDRKRARPDWERESKDWGLRRRYGMTLAEWEHKYDAQDGCCAICLSLLPREVSRRVHVDHDHVPRTLRGLRCGTCNQGLGNFKDNVDALRAAADYLEKHALAAAWRDRIS